MAIYRSDIYPCQHAFIENMQNSLHEGLTDILEYKYYCTIQDLNVVVTGHRDYLLKAKDSYRAESRIEYILGCCRNNCKYLKDSF